MRIEIIKEKMRKWRDSAGFDLSGGIDSIASAEDVQEILRNHCRWLENLANEAQRSTEDFEKELLGE